MICGMAVIYIVGTGVLSRQASSTVRDKALVMIGKVLDCP